ncbi:uncharacterized protein AMSG_11611 [Thecamonas trahens ATCC 50062]|uniref:Ras-GEF domain-containing protein n=1 Tax=Thecamonas trahens ATCC 50062 TaxID=461836 RepID=A0A0L0DEG1_THETB|nr:hypothetical protein AMSG_11611 [Thecamonas trahens ATCC 50062]KNC50546.1 hypothetical protein AMSG_11611 [Thecamonas trahens ATCC 50062]|eukprot:XP_013762590.1 hypothetical protein AMSG_11611 [Thecamonas trahens ATCC 50062]
MASRWGSLGGSGRCARKSCLKRERTYSPCLPGERPVTPPPSKRHAPLEASAPALVAPRVILPHSTPVHPTSTGGSTVAQAVDMPQAQGSPAPLRRSVVKRINYQPPAALAPPPPPCELRVVASLREEAALLACPPLARFDLGNMAALAPTGSFSIAAALPSPLPPPPSASRPLFVHRARASAILHAPAPSAARHLADAELRRAYARPASASADRAASVPSSPAPAALTHAPPGCDVLAVDHAASPTRAAAVESLVARMRAARSRSAASLTSPDKVSLDSPSPSRPWSPPRAPRASLAELLDDARSPLPVPVPTQVVDPSSPLRIRIGKRRRFRRMVTLATEVKDEVKAVTSSLDSAGNDDCLSDGSPSSDYSGYSATATSPPSSPPSPVWPLAGSPTPPPAEEHFLTPLTVRRSATREPASSTVSSEGSTSALTAVHRATPMALSPAPASSSSSSSTSLRFGLSSSSSSPDDAVSDVSMLSAYHRNREHRLWQRGNIDSGVAKRVMEEIDPKQARQSLGTAELDALLDSSDVSTASSPTPARHVAILRKRMAAAKLKNHRHSRELALDESHVVLGGLSPVPEASASRDSLASLASQRESLASVVALLDTVEASDGAEALQLEWSSDDGDAASSVGSAVHPEPHRVSQPLTAESLQAAVTAALPPHVDWDEVGSEWMAEFEWVGNLPADARDDELVLTVQRGTRIHFLEASSDGNAESESALPLFGVHNGHFEQSLWCMTESGKPRLVRGLPWLVVLHLALPRAHEAPFFFLFTPLLIRSGSKARQGVSAAGLAAVMLEAFEASSTRAQLRLGSLVLEWVHRHPEDFSECRVGGRLHGLMSKIGAKLKLILPLFGTRLDALFNRALELGANGKHIAAAHVFAHQPGIELVAIGRRHPLDGLALRNSLATSIQVLINLPAEQVATALTLVDLAMFELVADREIVQLVREQVATGGASTLVDVPAVGAVLARAVHIERWVVTCVLGGISSTRVLEAFIDVAWECVALRNFHTAVAIARGLEDEAVRGSRKRGVV